MNPIELIDAVPEFAYLIALEIKKNLTPHEDSISTNEAYRRYGRAWVEKYQETGQLHPERKGGKKIFSVSELERVKTKELIAKKNRQEVKLTFSKRKS